MKYRFFYIQTGILFLLNIILLNLPLTNILGYEFSVINSILLTLLSGYFVITILNRADKKDKEHFNGFLKTLIEGDVTFIIIPLLMGLAAALFIKNCSITTGLAFYTVITLPAIIIGTSLGVISYYISERFPKSLFLLLFIIILALPLYELYFNPQIYFYNPILAYLPGTIYDEAVKIDWKLISYRLINIIFFFSCLAYFLRILFLNGDMRSRRIFNVLAVLSISLIFFIFSHYLGYATTQGRMRADLEQKIETEHFDIFFDEGVNKKAVKLIALLHEYYFTEISNYLDIIPSGRTTSFIFRNSAQKKELLGTANADMAKPWLRTIFVNYGNYEQTLKHEIVHSLSAEFGATIFKLGGYFNPALTEGIASAADDMYDENSIHFMAALAYRNGYRLNIAGLFSGLSFFGEVSGLSYIYAGSFSKYLIDTYGAEKYKRIYSGDNFIAVYSKDISGLEKDYEKYIEHYPGEYTDAMADYYFGRLTIFRKPCARYLAEQIAEGWKKFNKGNFRESRREFEKLFKQTDSYSAFSGFINSLLMSNNDKAAFDLIMANQHKYINTAYYYSTGLMLADAAVKLKKFSFADSIYRSIIEQKPSRSTVYISLLRRELLKDTSVIHRYISGLDKEKYEILKQMNTDSLNFITIPVLINLGEQYQFEIDQLKSDPSNIKAEDAISSYSVYKLSEYALRNNNYTEAKQLAEKAIEHSGSLKYLMQSHLKKLNWLTGNSEALSKSIR